MNNQIADLGFEPQLQQIKNYPDGFVMPEQLEKEKRMNLEIIEDNGGGV